MREFSSYTTAQFKRSIRYFPFVFLVTLIIFICLALFLVTMIDTDNSKEDQAKIQIGITGSYDDTFLGFGLSAIQSFDSSRFAMDILEMEEDEAAKKLNRGEITGYIVLPENYIKDATEGNVRKLQFFTNYANADIVNMFKDEVLDLVSCIIVESQKGAYGIGEAMRELGASRSEAYDEMMGISSKYINLILKRSEALEINVVGVADSLSFGGYMFSGITVLLMLLSGIVTCPLFIRRDMSLYKLLSANRRRAASQIIGEYLAFFFIMLLNNVILLSALMIGIGKTDVITELAELHTPEMLLLVLKFIPAIALITSLQFLMYQLSDSVVSGVLMQFVSSVLLGYLSGCFYPISFFPKAIRAVSEILPSGIARNYLSTLITGNFDPLNIIAILSFFVVFTALSVLVRHHKIKTA